jgi:hypothetical protein
LEDGVSLWGRIIIIIIIRLPRNPAAYDSKDTSSKPCRYSCNTAQNIGEDVAIITRVSFYRVA